MVDADIAMVKDARHEVFGDANSVIAPGKLLT